jgi:hypothetical protein
MRIDHNNLKTKQKTYNNVVFVHKSILNEVVVQVVLVLQPNDAVKVLHQNFSLVVHSH